MNEKFEIGKVYRCTHEAEYSIEGVVWVVQSLTETLDGTQARGTVLASLYPKEIGSAWSSTSPTWYEELSEEEALIYKIGR